MLWYESEVRELERANGNRLKTRVNGNRPPVFYGSSSIRLWDTLAGRTSTQGVVNLGFGGSTLEACDYFFALALVPPVNPRSLLLYAGENDLGDGRTVEQVLGWFRVA